jgi:hypothetical protein
MSKFNIGDCKIPTVWCGNGKVPLKNKYNKNSKYCRKGTRLECFRKGMGKGMYDEIGKKLPKNSLRNIYYIGDKYENKFKENGVKNISELKKKINNNTVSQNKKFLLKILTKKNKKLDVRAYNSTLFFLHDLGLRKIPMCQKIKCEK